MSRALLSAPRLGGRPAAVAAVVVAIAVTALGGAARAEDQAAFGQLEKETLDDGIARTNVTIDPHPQGKTVGAVVVVNEEVFSRRDWLLQFLNIFHRTTRDAVLAREVLLRPGQIYDQDLVDETVRNLRQPASMIVAGTTIYPPELSSVIAIVPVVSLRPGEVDLLVVTRDVWSLRFNTNFEYQGNALTLLDTSLSENNLFGWRKFVSARFRLDQGSASFGPTYFDPNIRGTRLTMFAEATLWYARDTERYDGNSEVFFLRYPLYSLASRWGAGVDVTHTDTLVRYFRGNALLPWDLRATPDVIEMLPYVYRQRRATVDSSVVRSFGAGSSLIQRVTAGHLFDSRRFSVPPNFPDPADAAEFLREVAPISEQRSEPYLRYQIFTPRYLIIRDLDTFDLRENLQLGPSFAARVSYGLPALGADFAALGLAAAASWAVSPWGGYGKLSLTASTRLRDGRFIDQTSTEELYLATPFIGRAVRVVVDGKAAATRADTQNTRFFLGGTTGLRGYAINEIDGTSVLILHVELRSQAARLFSQRIGGLLFYDGGGAAPSFGQLVGYHDFGLGLRWLIPQLNSSVLRFDWAVPTADATLTRAGFPGRLTAGFDQAF